MSLGSRSGIIRFIVPLGVLAQEINFNNFLATFLLANGGLIVQVVFVLSRLKAR